MNSARAVIVVEKIERAIVISLSALAGLGVLALMVHVVANAVSRATVSVPINGTLEYVGNWYLPIIVLCAFALAQQKRQHVEARILFDKAPGRVKSEFETAGYLLTLVVAGMFAWSSLLNAVDAMEIGRTAGVSGIVVWPAYFAVPLGFFLYGVQVMIDLAKHLGALRTTPEGARA